MRLAQTSNLKLSVKIYEHLASTQRPERMAIFYGKRGLGKTTILQFLADEYNGVYLYCLPNYSPRSFVDDLLGAAGIVAPINSSTAAIIRDLGHYLKDSRRPLLLDNCDDIATIRLLSIVRSIQDLAQVPVIMVGMERLKIKLNRCPELLDRARVIKFKEIARKEVSDLATAMSDIDIAAELLDKVHEASKGRIRRASGSIESIHEFASRFGLKKIGLAEWGEQDLVVSGDPGE